MRQVTFKPAQAKILMNLAVAAVAHNRLAEKGLDAIMTRLMKALNAQVDPDGTGQIRYAAGNEDIPLELSDMEIFGAKYALVQATNGLTSAQRARANEGYRQITLRPIAKALGIERVYMKDTAVDEKGPEEEPKIDFDEAPAAPAEGEAKG